MSVTVGLIRHGVTDWNVQEKAQGREDIPLNDVGLAQAKSLARRLAAEPWDLVISSPLIRAKQTANEICSAIGINELLMDERLLEIHCGEIEGTTEEERIAKWGANWREHTYKLGMEPYADVAERGVNFLQDIGASYTNCRIAVISHGALIGLTLQKLLPERFQTTMIHNTSLTVLHYVEGAWSCGLYNCTRHL